MHPMQFSPSPSFVWKFNFDATSFDFAIYIYIDARSYSLVPCFRIRRRIEEEYLPLTAESYKQTRTNVNKRDDVIIKERIERWSGEVWFLVAIPLRNPLLHLFSSSPPPLPPFISRRQQPFVAGNVWPKV